MIGTDVRIPFKKGRWAHGHLTSTRSFCSFANADNCTALLKLPLLCDMIMKHKLIPTPDLVLWALLSASLLSICGLRHPQSSTAARPSYLEISNVMQVSVDIRQPVNSTNLVFEHDALRNRAIAICSETITQQY